MTEIRANQDGGAATQLGARARTVLGALAQNAPSQPDAKVAARRPAGDARPVADAGPVAAERPVAPQPANAGLVSAAPVRRAPEVAAARATPEIVAPSDPGKVVTLPRRRPPGEKIAPRRDVTPRPAARPAAGPAKKSLLKVSALLAIGLPTALAGIYYGFFAAPQYVAEAKFAVRGPEENASGGDLMGRVTGLATAATATAGDSFIVAQYIESGRLVSGLQKLVDLRAVYTHSNADLLAKYRPYDADDTVEHLTRYWNSVSKVYYEPISGIISLTVRAFTPDDALKIARETVRESEQLVNKLSERAREDAIFDTKQELSRAELRLKFARKAIQDYRDREGSVDPAKNADSQLTIISNLEGDLAKQEAEMASALSFLSKDAPTVRVMRTRIDALKQRVDTERAKIGSTNAIADKMRPLLSTSLAEFEALTTEREFAEKSYESALGAVENARMRSERQSRYLATFVEPQLPEDSLYPARIQSVLLVLLCSAIAWAIGVLVFYGIRDHSA